VPQKSKPKLKEGLKLGVPYILIYSDKTSTPIHIPTLGRPINVESDQEYLQPLKEFNDNRQKLTKLTNLKYADNRFHKFVMYHKDLLYIEYEKGNPVIKVREGESQNAAKYAQENGIPYNGEIRNVAVALATSVYGVQRGDKVYLNKLGDPKLELSKLPELADSANYGRAFHSEEELQQFAQQLKVQVKEELKEYILSNFKLSYRDGYTVDSLTDKIIADLFKGGRNLNTLLIGQVVKNLEQIKDDSEARILFNNLRLKVITKKNIICGKLGNILKSVSEQVFADSPIISHISEKGEVMINSLM